MKLLVVCSSLDLKAPLSATPAWWQLLKGLYEVGVDLVVTTYHGAAIESPWWRAYENPAKLEGDLFQWGRSIVRRASSPGGAPPEGTGETTGHRAIRQLAHAIVAPRWRRHLSRILEREAGVDAVVLINVPPNHVSGVPEDLRKRFGVPVIFYDGDVPASLPHFQGFATGFRIYDGADLREFNLVVCNSEGADEALRALGARDVRTLHYAADPGIYAPLDVPQDLDIFFFGHTSEYRADWLRDMIATPSRTMPDVRFAVRGRELGDVGKARVLPYLSYSRLREYIARSRINLVVTRQAHARTFASSTMRPFELAMMGATMVSNPCEGMERWFEPGRELVIVSSGEEAFDRYRHLLAHDAERRAIGDAARKRALAEHTWQHRARELTRMIGDVG